MLNFRADLHSHTYFSDGSSSPEALLRLAKDSNLQGLSITDHDNVEAYEEALPIAKELDIKLLPGIELSAYHGKHSIHILGYGFDLKNEALLSTCHELAEARTAGNRLVLDKLKRHGFNISEEELTQTFTHRTLGRPHIAQLMVQKGYVPNVKAAFSDYLGDKAPCARGALKVLSVADTISLIHQAGGLAVLAHPYHLKHKKLIHTLLNLDCKFDGIETFYGLMPPHLEKPVVEFALFHKLIMTGGSDFHGDMTPHLRLGCSFTPEETFNKFYSLAKLNNTFL